MAKINGAWKLLNKEEEYYLVIEIGELITLKTNKFCKLRTGNKVIAQTTARKWNSRVSDQEIEGALNRRRH